METEIYFFSGTGNSLVLARKIAAGLGNTEVINLRKHDGREVTFKSQCVGIVFPVYAWGVPLIVRRFLQNVLRGKLTYFFAVCDCASLQGKALTQVQKLLSAKEISLDASFNVVMPSNYIPFGGAEPERTQKRKFTEAEEQIRTIVDVIQKRQKTALDESGFPPTFLAKLMYHFFSKRLPKFSRKYHVSKDCSGCGLCEKICPVGNIKLKDGHPIWGRECECCMACLQFCPESAILCGKIPATRKHYHHPEVKAQDLF